MNLRDMGCCGMREICGIQFTKNAKEAMVEFMKAALPRGLEYDWHTDQYKYIAELSFSHVVFSEANDTDVRYGELFAAMIEKEKLGTVVASQRRKNPNSGNQLKFWVWTLNKQGIIKWAKKNKVHPEGTLLGVAW